MVLFAENVIFKPCQIILLYLHIHIEFLSQNKIVCKAESILNSFLILFFLQLTAHFLVIFQNLEATCHIK